MFARPEGSLRQRERPAGAPKAIRILGGYGNREGYPVERYPLDIRIAQRHEGAGEIQRLPLLRARGRHEM
ncbi:acyl-CoA dehydrogenase family protein [Pseudomonas oryzihabitans]|uniref:acyl-CoA dehydrogenase family protein n=1 Tax=Pseudomonas oryzihabitans TaxID=47885 RepID=UPI001643007A|nr:acyl-CoA dehydrogenase family protein [Pseudomonas psychrotolerans]